MNDPKDLDPRGIKWMGDTPDDWGKEPVKRHYEIQLGKMLQNNPSTDNDILVPYLKALHVLWGRIEKDNLPEMWASLKENQQYSVRDGDLLVCEGGEVGRAGIVKSPPEKCIIQNALHRIRPKKSSDVCFLQWVLHTVSSSGWFDVLCNRATIAHFTREKVANLRIPVPQKDEQRAIASFLDRGTNRIDTLISKKVRQIELLQERRKALISNAVTKGLDPSVKMKDSGVEWLGEIPAHWSICLLKRVMHIRYGIGGELDRSLTEGVPILSLPNVRIDGNLDLEEVPFTDLSTSQKSAYLLKKGDLLFNWRNGSSDHLGKTAYFDLEGDYTHVSFLLRLRCHKEKLDPRYFHRLLNGLHITGFFSSSKAGVNNTFNMSELANLWVIVPPFNEQSAIADLISREIKRIDIFIKKVRKSMNLLQEYRSALISAVVTGKIDLRNAV